MKFIRRDKKKVSPKAKVRRTREKSFARGKGGKGVAKLRARILARLDRASSCFVEIPLSLPLEARQTLNKDDSEQKAFNLLALAKLWPNPPVQSPNLQAD
jgi:hypothetical protein